MVEDVDMEEHVVWNSGVESPYLEPLLPLPFMKGISESEGAG